MLYGSTSCKLVERGEEMEWFAVEKMPYSDKISSDGLERWGDG